MSIWTCERTKDWICTQIYVNYSVSELLTKVSQWWRKWSTGPAKFFSPWKHGQRFSNLFNIHSWAITCASALSVHFVCGPVQELLLSGHVEESYRVNLTINLRIKLRLRKERNSISVLPQHLCSQFSTTLYHRRWERKRQKMRWGERWQQSDGERKAQKTLKAQIM